MKVVFLGSGAFGLPTLQTLARAHQVLAIVSQPDRPAGRGGALTPTPISAWAATSLPTTPLLKPLKVNDAAIVAALRALNADAWVVIAFGQKLGRTLLGDTFAINLHASLLPRWRGAAPINAAILAGDPVSGNSVITLADKMDAGLILDQSRRAVDPAMTAGELHDLLAADGPALVQSVLAHRLAGTLAGVDQDDAAVTVAPKLSKADGWLDFSETAEDCRRRIHGLTPWPGVTVRFRDEPLKLLRAKVAPHPAQQGVVESGKRASIGTVIEPAGGLIACGGQTQLQLLQVHPAGSKAMSWEDFTRGRRPKAGEALVGGGRAC